MSFREWSNQPLQTGQTFFLRKERFPTKTRSGGALAQVHSCWNPSRHSLFTSSSHLRRLHREKARGGPRVSGDAGAHGTGWPPAGRSWNSRTSLPQEVAVRSPGDGRRAITPAYPTTATTSITAPNAPPLPASGHPALPPTPQQWRSQPLEPKAPTPIWKQASIVQ